MKKGKNRLKEIAITEAGLLNDDFRRKVWPRLLDIDMVETSVVPSDEIVKSQEVGCGAGGETKFDPGKSFLQLLVYLGSPKHGPAEPVCLHFNNRD